MLGHFLGTSLDLAPAAESGGRFARDLKIPVGAGIVKSMPNGATSADLEDRRAKMILLRVPRVSAKNRTPRHLEFVLF
jgi:hypothetical protein